MSEWLQSQNMQNIAISLGIFAFAVIMSLFVRLILSPILRRLTARTDTDLDDILVRALRRPVAWGILLAGAWLALRRVWSPERIEDLDKGAAVLGVLLLVSAALRTFNSVAAWWSQKAAAKSDHPREVMA